MTALVAAGDTREHLTRLLRYVSLDCISTLSAVPRRTLRAIHDGHRTQIPRETHDAIIETGWDLDAIPARYLVPGFCVARRLDALACLGWGIGELAPLLGLDTAELRRLHRAERVPAATAQQLRDLYDRHSMCIGPNAMARQAALHAGHRPPLDWDGDDLDLHPDDMDPIGRRDRTSVSAARLAGLIRIPSRRNSLDDAATVRRLKTQGLSDQLIAQRLGITPRTVQRIRARHRIPVDVRTTAAAAS